MITFDAFLVFLLAAALPVIYLAICRRWIEPAYRNANWSPQEGKPVEAARPARPSTRATFQSGPARQAA